MMVLSSQCTCLYYLDCNRALLLSLHKRAGAWAKYFFTSVAGSGVVANKVDKSEAISGFFLSGISKIEPPLLLGTQVS